jgi:ferritin-like metal-binding protein YciE
VKAATSPELQDALSTHLEETNGQVARLEKMGEILGKKMTGKTCVGMKGVLEEGSEILEDTEKGTVRDAALISACQRVEHYEMAGTARRGSLPSCSVRVKWLRYSMRRWPRKRMQIRS